MLVLLGMSKTLDRSKNLRMFIEVSHKIVESGYSIEDLLNFLLERDFIIFDVRRSKKISDPAELKYLYDSLLGINLLVTKSLTRDLEEFLNNMNKDEGK